MNKSYSSPNRMVWEFFQALRRLCGRIQVYESESEIRQDSALCVILAVNGVEVFLNVYFRVLVSESQYRDSYDRVIADLKNQVGIETKIKEWPGLVLGRDIDFASGVGQKFIELKKKRNKLTHFSSSHEKLDFQGVTIDGAADTSIYDAMTKETAFLALEVSEKFICEIFRLRGIEAEQVPHAMHAWTGKIPSGA